MTKAFNRVLSVALIVVALCVFFVYAFANMEHFTATMESDTASETLLAEVLYNNGHVQPDTWQMSTGQRIIAPPMLASFIYPFTGFDLNLSMGIATTLLVILFLASMLFFNRSIGLSFLESLVAIVLTLVLYAPQSEIQRHLFLYAAYYVVHFTCMFFVLGIYARALKKDRLPVVLAIITVPLAIINGMQGMHASLFFYMSLLGTELLRRIVLFIKKKKSSIWVTLWVVVISLGSVVSFKVFGTHMVSDVSRNLRHAPEKFFDIVFPFFKSVLSIDRFPVVVAILIVLGIMGYVLAALKLGSLPELWSALPIPFGVVVVILSTTFTTAEASPRYYLMQVFVVAVGVALLIHLFKPDMTMWLSLLVIFFGITSATAFYNYLIKGDHADESDEMQVVRFMQDNGYEYGYSAFDYANMMTVMANNSVKIRPVNSFAEMEGSKWLSDSTWYPPYKSADGAVCYVVSEARLDDFNEFVSSHSPVITDTQQFGRLTVYVTDRDYTVWAD